MKLTRYLAPLIAAASIALPAVAHGQNVQFNGFVSPTTFLGEEVVGPYKLQKINPAQPEFLAYCIDIKNSVTQNPWTARFVSFNDAINDANNLAALRYSLGAVFPGYGTPASTTDLLTNLKASSILAGQFGVNPTTAWDEIHWAIWTLFENPATNSSLVNPSNLADATNRRSNAITASASGNYDSWQILIDERAYDAEYRRLNGTVNQVFITNAPEPSTYALMGVGLLALGVAARRRNRMGALSA
jgi:hypothetical protein